VYRHPASPFVYGFSAGEPVPRPRRRRCMWATML
jgi:hypothetical protein